MTTVFGMTAYTNPLNPDAFPGIRKMEAEVRSEGLDMCPVHPVVTTHVQW